MIYSTSSAHDANHRCLDATIPALRSVESSVNWIDGTMSSTTATTVSKDTTTGVLFLAVYSQSGTCFFMLEGPPNDTRYASMAAGTLG